MGNGGGEGEGSCGGWWGGGGGGGGSVRCVLPNDVHREDNCNAMSGKLGKVSVTVMYYLLSPRASQVSGPLVMPVDLHPVKSWVL